MYHLSNADLMYLFAKAKTLGLAELFIELLEYEMVRRGFTPEELKYAEEA